MLLETIQRFLKKIKIAENGCWLWIASLNPVFGYSAFRYNQQCGNGHRFIWLYLYGSIPKGLEIDHLCRNRACVNPKHLELVTHKENLLRGDTFQARNAKKTQCPQGHPLDGSNIYKQKDGKRRCRICHVEYLRNWRKKRPNYDRRYQ